MANYVKEIEKRRTFAIISHPDAGKTTLTEKFLLYGGAINLAGSVKGKATARHAVSDWMEIEKERGISVTSSVLQFNYDNYCINILDTPGHQDFSEDTYRTLMAADSAVMVIDGSKGVEPQTRKLFKVCAMRHIPIFTFINKMDRDAMDIFELLDDIENELGIATCPINWPLGSGKEFKGVYDRSEKKILLFSDTEKGTKEGEELDLSIDDPELDKLLVPGQKEKLLDDIELLDLAGDEFDMDKVNSGEELTWDDLNSATWAVLNPTSASGYIYPSLWLQENYGKGISDLEHVVECDSHTTSVARLAAGQVDVMVSYGHIRIKNAPIWQSDFGGTAPMAEQTGVIGVTEGIYNDMIAYSKTSDTMADEAFRTAVGESFIELAQTEEGQAIFSVFSQVGYDWGSDADYDGERDAQALLKSMEE